MAVSKSIMVVVISIIMIYFCHIVILVIQSWQKMARGNQRVYRQKT